MTIPADVARFAVEKATAEMGMCAADAKEQERFQPKKSGRQIRIPSIPE